MADGSGVFTIDDLRVWSAEFQKQTARQPKWVVVTPEQGDALRMAVSSGVYGAYAVPYGTMNSMAILGLPVLEREKHEMIPDGSLDLRWVRMK